MAITTLDGTFNVALPHRPFIKTVPTTVVGLPLSLWYGAGVPGAGSGAGTTAGGVALSSSSAPVAGQIYHADPAGGANSYLARFAAAFGSAGMLMLCDRLLHCGGTTTGAAISTTVTTAQVLNTVALPARDLNGTTNGFGVLAAVEIATTVGAGSPTLTLNYTNSAGTTGRTGTNVIPTASSAQQGTFFPIGYQSGSGDMGVRSVQSLTMSTTWSTTGALNIVLFRVLAMLELSGSWIGNGIDALTGGFPQLFNGTVPWVIWVPSSTTSGQIHATYEEAQG